MAESSTLPRQFSRPRQQELVFLFNSFISIGCTWPQRDTVVQPAQRVVGYWRAQPFASPLSTAGEHLCSQSCFPSSLPDGQRSSAQRVRLSIPQWSRGASLKAMPPEKSLLVSLLLSYSSALLQSLFCLCPQLALIKTEMISSQSPIFIFIFFFRREISGKHFVFTTGDQTVDKTLEHSHTSANRGSLKDQNLFQLYRG